MSSQQGRRAWVGIALEANVGDPIAPASYLPFLECGLKERHTPIPELAARGIRDEQGENSARGKKWGEGPLKINVDPTLAGYLLGLVMGNFGTPSQEGSSGVWNHTLIRKTNNEPKTASITFDRVTDRQLFHYVVVDSLDFSVEDGMAEITANCLSRMPVATSSGSLTTVSGTLFTFKDVDVRIAADLASAVGATPLKVKSFSLTISNTAEMIYFFDDGDGNEGDVDEIIVKNFGINGEISLNFENTTQREIFRNLSKRAMIVTLTGKGIGAGLNEYIKFRIAKMRFEDYNVDVPIDDVITEGISFVGEYSSNDAKTLDIQLRNRKSSY